MEETKAASGGCSARMDHNIQQGRSVRSFVLLVQLPEELLLSALRWLGPQCLTKMSYSSVVLSDCALHDDIWIDIYKTFVGVVPPQQDQAFRAWVHWNQRTRNATTVLITPQQFPPPIPRGYDLPCASPDGKSIDFGGSIDTGFPVEYSDRLALGTDDFTVEMWLKLDREMAGKVTQGECEGLMMMSFGWLSENMKGLDLYTTGAWHASYESHTRTFLDHEHTRIGVNAGNAGIYLTPSHPCHVYGVNSSTYWEACDGDFHHFAHCLSGGRLRLYQDGQLVAEAPFTDEVDPKEDLFVGSKNNDCRYHPREVAEFRMIRGQARYQGNFTPVRPRCLL